MAANVLVAYATVHGSTKEIAEVVADILGHAGLRADLKPAGEVRSLEGYNAVVLGAPFYMFAWHKDARRFLSRHRKALESLPVSIFALGPFHNKEEELDDVRKQLAKEIARYPWLRPTSIEVFVGKFDPAHLRFPYSLIPAMKSLPPSDERDWNAIRAWATTFAERLIAA